MAGDPSWNSVDLLLHGNGSNGSTTILDSSPLALAMTASGNAKISTAVSTMYGGAAISFDGTNSYVRSPTRSEFNFNTGDLTLELKARPLSLSGDPYLLQFFNSSTERFALQFTAAGGASFYSTTATAVNVTTAVAPASTFVAGTDYQLSITRQGTTWRFFVNGALVYSGTPGHVLTNNSCLVELGAAVAANAAYFNGYIEEVRVTKGVARYTAAYTPPAAAFPDGMGQVSGTVKDSTGAAAARTVRAYRRDTGALVGNVTSDPTTGAYSFYTPTLDELTLLALDSATSGTIYDDICERVIPA